MEKKRKKNVSTAYSAVDVNNKVMIKINYGLVSLKEKKIYLELV